MLNNILILSPDNMFQMMQVASVKFDGLKWIMFLELN